jgi:hypothetical protein
MGVASGTEIWDEGSRAGLCRDGLKAELWMIRPPVGSPSGQQDGCGSGEARQPGGNERQDCHRSDRGKHDYGEPLGRRCDGARS